MRETAGVVPANIDCSSGRNTLTSPEVGLSVPMTPITTSAVNEVAVPNSAPLMIISTDPPNSND